jgi:molybdate transport system substrate-binding protein
MRQNRARMGIAVICLAVVALLSAACGASSNAAIRTTSASQKVSGTVVVFAAASLKDAFDQIGKQFEQANPGVTVKFNYAGSSSLATQIKQAAPADVFASADTTNMDTVTNDNLASNPQVFAKNTLEIMVAAGNPKHIKSVADLANSDVKVAVCASDVPCGKYTQEVFKNAGVTVNPVSEETSVSSVVTKVTLGEADAGVVYTTDVKAAGDKAAGVAIPANQNVTAEYPIVALKDAPNKDGATAFINYVLSSAGQKVLQSFGFLPAGK